MRTFWVVEQEYSCAGFGFGISIEFKDKSVNGQIATFTCEKDLFACVSVRIPPDDLW